MRKYFHLKFYGKKIYSIDKMVSDTKVGIDTSMCKPFSIILHRLKKINVQISSQDFVQGTNGESNFTMAVTRSDFESASKNSVTNLVVQPMITRSKRMSKSIPQSKNAAGELTYYTKSLDSD